ncbi:monocarboxylate transporter 10-like protein kar [Leptinotarsa decemlineata]|uniref:monocarboxylate transporter 10-like protein kar n=1 Tax=Leptinotarsa decemlineata TaxID=7539 RepID=UPI000C2522B9|nr:monocarboxylate transporter 10 [Leptinotarsa decemlineata]
MTEDVETNLVVTQKIDVNLKNQQNGTAEVKENEKYTPPSDGGSRAWIVMLGSFFCNGILFGVINSYGVIYSELHDDLQRRNVTNAAGKAALVGSFAMGTTFFVSPVSGMLTDYIGLRKTTFLGGAIASSGMFLSSFFVDNIVALCITYGIMYGLGGSLAYTPSLAILGHYFKRYLGKVNGFVTAGSSVFTVVMPYAIDALLKAFGVVWTLRTLALVSSLIMVCAFLFKPTNKNVTSKKISVKDVFNTSLTKNRRYVFWAMGIACSLFGYFVPYVYMLKFVSANFDKGSDTKLPILCIGVTSGLGRLIFGYIADLPKVNRIYLQQLSFFSIGLLTILLPFSAGKYGWLIVIVLGMGLFDGCFISLLGPIAFDICGREGATQAIGFLLGICAIPLTIGPYIAGVILDNTSSYTLPLILAGIPPILGSLGMFALKFTKGPTKRREEGEAPLRGANNETELVGKQEEDGL